MATSRPGVWGPGVSQDESFSVLVPSRSWANGEGWSVDMYLSSQWPAVGHLGCVWFLNITHATEDISSHMFVPSCTCVQKIKFLKEKLLGKKGTRVSNFHCYCQLPSRSVPTPPTMCESVHFPVSLAELEIVKHFGLCHLIGDKECPAGFFF